jgi:hypothetical protein
MVRSRSMPGGRRSVGAHREFFNGASRVASRPLATSADRDSMSLLLLCISLNKSVLSPLTPFPLPLERVRPIPRWIITVIPRVYSKSHGCKA